MSAVPEGKQNRIKISFYVRTLKKKYIQKLGFDGCKNAWFLYDFFYLYLHNKLKVWGLFNILREVSFGDQGCIYMIKTTVK